MPPSMVFLVCFFLFRIVSISVHLTGNKHTDRGVLANLVYICSRIPAITPTEQLSNS